MADATGTSALSTSERSACGQIGLPLFYAALVIYALFGDPTPEHVSFVEITIGLALIVLVGFHGLNRALDFSRGGRWKLAGRLLLCYSLTVPLFAGLIEGNRITDIVRDIIPFLFFLLPLFVVHNFENRPKAIRTLTALTVFIGLSFSLRVFIPNLLSDGPISDPLLLANVPSVLFAGLLLIGLSGLSLYRGLPPPYALKGAAFMFLALIPIATMALINQRAHVGIMLAAVAFLLILGFARKPYRMGIPLILLLVSAAIYWPLLSEIAQGAAHKTALVGFNMRWQEALAVFNEISGSLWSVLFGHGWGATVASPAVGGEIVTFTHSLITTFWLKTGLIGLILVLYYLYALALKLWPLLWRFPVMAVALAGPLLVDVTLYASFKSLDFGLLLLLIPLWASWPDSLHKKYGYSKKEQVS